MKLKFVIPGLALSASILGAMAAHSADAETLVPRHLLFRDPAAGGAALSPDGKWIAFTAPHNGVTNIWVAPIDRPQQRRPVTDARSQPIFRFQWAPDSRQILLRQDEAGGARLYGVDIMSGKVLDYFALDGAHAQILAISPGVPDAILVTLSQRDPTHPDVYRLELRTGALKLVWKNEAEYTSFIADPDLNLRLARKDLPGGGFTTDVIRTDGSTSHLFDVGAEDGHATAVLSAPSSEQFVYVTYSRGRDTAALVRIDLTTAQKVVVGAAPNADIDVTLMDARTGMIHAYRVEHQRPHWVAIDDAYRHDVSYLDRMLNGSWRVSSQSADARLWTVIDERPTVPPSVYLYDRRAQRLTKLLSSYPGLEGQPLQPMHPVVIPARDGLDLVSYLTLPRSVDANGDGRAETPVPMVLLVHGGPWLRDHYGFNPSHQWLASRGYAVLSVNFRGSVGFGKRFMNAADLQWGRAMQTDLLDAADWAIAQKIAKPNQIAIMGASYGGYAALMGLADTPDRFACGIDAVGPLNLETPLNTSRARGSPGMSRRIGDLTTDAGRHALAAVSPLSHAHRIRKPLLIEQGANDPGVKRSEVDQLVATMNRNHVPVIHLLYPDEGHGLFRPQNVLSFHAISEAFLSRCLGGDLERFGSDFTGSTVQIPQGIDLIDSLAGALDGSLARPPGR